MLKVLIPRFGGGSLLLLFLPCAEQYRQVTAAQIKEHSFSLR